MKKFFLWIAAIVLLAVIPIACSGAEKDMTPVNALSVEMSEFKFNPSSMVVFAGQNISLDLRNAGAVEHDFTILKKGAVAKTPFDREAQRADILFEYKLGANKSSQLHFFLPEPGEYQVICGIQGHFESGMVATLTAK